MTEHSWNIPGKGHTDVQGYPTEEESYDRASEVYEPAEAVFLGKEGERPENARGNVALDLESERLFREELQD